MKLWRKGGPCISQVGIEIDPATLKIPLKIKTAPQYAPYDPTSSKLDMLPREMRSECQIYICPPVLVQHHPRYLWYEVILNAQQ